MNTSTVLAVYPVVCGGAVAIATAPPSLDLGDHDRDLTPAEVAQLTVLVWLTPAQAVLLAQQLFDAATPTLTLDQIEQIRTTLIPAPVTV